MTLSENKATLYGSWFFCALCCLYIAWICYRFTVVAPSFRQIYIDIGVAIPARTEFIINFPVWLLSSLSIVFIAALIAKEIFISSKIITIIITFSVFLLAGACGLIVADSLLVPFLGVMESVAKPDA